MSILENKLNSIYKEQTQCLTIKTSLNDKYVIFSDLHRGLGDMSDDFKNDNQACYHTALDHYYAQDFSLVHLGDIEELKEQWSIESVLAFNKKHLIKEAAFHTKSKYYRVFGNHDSRYEKDAAVEKYLHPYFPTLKVYEGILLEYEDLPKVLMVHGHQDYVPFVTGLFEYIGLPFYKLYINLVNKNRETNYDSYCKIEKSENAIYDWTIRQDNLILIFGHTHRPLWGSRTHVEKIQLQLIDLNEQLKLKAVEHKVSVIKIKENAVMYGADKIIETIKSLIEELKKKMEDQASCSKSKPLPVIFNSGCCIFEDGDITCIEIDHGQIRLIKWGIDKTTNVIRRFVLEEEFLGCLRTD